MFNVDNTFVFVVVVHVAPVTDECTTTILMPVPDPVRSFAHTVDVISGQSGSYVQSTRATNTTDSKIDVAKPPCASAKKYEVSLTLLNRKKHG